MFKRGRWVKLIRDISQNGKLIEPAGAVGITQNYRPGSQGQPLLEVHMVSFPQGETRAILILPDTEVTLVMTKAELPANRVGHLPDNWAPAQ